MVHTHMCVCTHTRPMILTTTCPGFSGCSRFRSLAGCPRSVTGRALTLVQKMQSIKGCYEGNRLQPRLQKRKGPSDCEILVTANRGVVAFLTCKGFSHKSSQARSTISSILKMRKPRHQEADVTCPRSYHWLVEGKELNSVSFQVHDLNHWDGLAGF